MRVRIVARRQSAAPLSSPPPAETHPPAEPAPGRPPHDAKGIVVGKGVVQCLGGEGCCGHHGALAGEASAPARQCHLAAQDIEGAVQAVNTPVETAHCQPSSTMQRILTEQRHQHASPESEQRWATSHRNVCSRSSCPLVSWRRWAGPLLRVVICKLGGHRQATVLLQELHDSASITISLPLAAAAAALAAAAAPAVAAAPPPPRCP